MTAAGMLAEARKSIGLSGRPNRITREYASRHGDEFESASWCDMAITYWARHSGNAAAVLPGGDRAYTVWHAQDFQRAGRWHVGTTAEVDRAQPGDIVFFDWGASNDVGAIDHVGVVEKVLGGGRLQTVEANTDDAVRRRVRSSSVIAGYGRPAYSGSSYGGPSTSSEEDDMPLSKDDIAKVAAETVEQLFHARYNRRGDTLGVALETTKDGVVALLARAPDVDEEEVARVVLAGLTPEKIAAAIPAELAEQVADEIGHRLTPKE